MVLGNGLEPHRASFGRDLLFERCHHDYSGNGSESIVYRSYTKARGGIRLVCLGVDRQLRILGNRLLWALRNVPVKIPVNVPVNTGG